MTSRGSAVPQPLGRRTVLASGNVDALVKAGTELFSPHHLKFGGRRARLGAAPVDAATVICLQYAGECVVATTEELDYYAVHLPVSGQGVVSFGDEQVAIRPGVGVVFNPGDRPAMRWSADTCLLAMRIPAPTLAGHVARLAGRSVDRPLRFAHQHSGARPSPWAAALHTVAGMVDQHRAAELPSGLAAGLCDMFLTSLVAGQPSSWTARLLTQRPTTRASVARAVELVAAAPEAPRTLADLADEAGVSVRALQAAFQREYGVSPMAYVRDRRLELAHRRLLDPAFGHRSVSDIAADAGFTHLGRFAAAYRRRYGTTPSQARGSR